MTLLTFPSVIVFAYTGVHVCSHNACRGARGRPTMNLVNELQVSAESDDGAETGTRLVCPGTGAETEADSNRVPVSVPSPPRPREDITRALISAAASERTISPQEGDFVRSARTGGLHGVPDARAVASERSIACWRWIRLCSLARNDHRKMLPVTNTRTHA
jgi:hypothetical protein